MKKNTYKLLIVLVLIGLLVGIHSISSAYTALEPNETIMYNYSIRVAATIQGAGGGTGSTGGASAQFDIDKVKSGAEKFLEDREQGNKFKEGTVEDMVKSIYNILLVLGIIVIVVVGIILSIKFITGSLEEQAQVKEMLVPYVVGTIVIFTAFAIWKLVVDILQSIQDL